MQRSILILQCSLVLSVGVLPPPSVTARPYSIDWYTIAGGGAMNVNGGAYLLSSTIGQPDAGNLAGGPYDTVGGFWALPQFTAPALTITLSGDTVLVCWPSVATGFKLQQSITLSPTTWSDVDQTPLDNGITKCVTLQLTSAATFYRLAN